MLSRLESALSKIDDHVSIAMDGEDENPFYGYLSCAKQDHDPEEQLIAVRSMNDVVTDAQVSKEYADKPETIELIPYLAKMMHSGDPAMVEAACTTAWYMGRGQVFRVRALEDEAFVTGVLSSVKTNITAAPLRALTNLAASDESEVVLIQQYKISKLLTAILPFRDGVGKGAVCGLIRNLAASNVNAGRMQFISDMVEPDMLVHIIQVMQSSDLENSYRAASAIGSVCFHSIPKKAEFDSAQLKEAHALTQKVSVNMTTPLSAEVEGVQVRCPTVEAVLQEMKNQPINGPTSQKTQQAVEEALVHLRASVEAATANLTRGGTRPTAESADELQMI